MMVKEERSIPNTLEQCLKNLVGDRLEINYPGMVYKNPEFRVYQDKLIELHKNIEHLLGPEQKKLMDEYEAIEGLYWYIQQEVAYMIGFKDGIRLMLMSKKIL